MASHNYIKSQFCIKDNTGKQPEYNIDGFSSPVTKFPNKKLHKHCEALPCYKEWKNNNDGAPCRLIAAFDLEGFKAINDRFSHLVGDDVLCSFCNIAHDVVLSISAGNFKRCVQFIHDSGDEFSVAQLLCDFSYDSQKGIPSEGALLPCPDLSIQINKQLDSFVYFLRLPTTNMEKLGKTLEESDKSSDKQYVGLYYTAPACEEFQYFGTTDGVTYDDVFYEQKDGAFILFCGVRLHPLDGSTSKRRGMFPDSFRICISESYFQPKLYPAKAVHCQVSTNLSALVQYESSANDWLSANDYVFLIVKPKNDFKSIVLANVEAAASKIVKGMLEKDESVEKIKCVLRGALCVVALPIFWNKSLEFHEDSLSKSDNKENFSSFFKQSYTGAVYWGKCAEYMLKEMHKALQKDYGVCTLMGKSYEDL